MGCLICSRHSVQFGYSVVSNSLRSHGLQHASLLCPSRTSRTCSNSLSQWCHQAISSFVIPFSSCLQSFPASGSFPKSQFFTSGDQSIGALAMSPVLPINKQDWFPLSLISLLSKGLSRVFSNTRVKKKSILSVLSFPYSPTLIFMHDYWKNHSFDYVDLVNKTMSLLFNKLSRFVIAFLLRSKHLLISWLLSPSAVILESKKIKSVTVSIVSPSICHGVMGPDAMILVFWMLRFKPTCSLSSYTFTKRLFIYSSFCHKGGVICISEVIDIFPSILDSSLCFIQPGI